MKKAGKLIVFIFAISFLFLQSCDDNDEAIIVHQNKANELVSRWFLLQTQLVKTTPNTPPPIAARNFAYSAITLYHSLYKVMGVTDLQGKINGIINLPTESSDRLVYSIVANAAISALTSSLFENTSDNNKIAIANLEAEMLQFYKSENNISEQQIIDESVALGKRIALAVYDYSKTDGGHQSYLNLFPDNYNMANGISAWQPTSSSLIKKPLLPYWGSNRTLLKANAKGFITVNDHPTFSVDATSEFYQQALEVYNVSKQLSQEKSVIANYWADGGNTFTPPGHLIALTIQLIEDENLDLYDATTLITKVSVGLYDASIVCWRTKYETYLLRPETYIKNYIDPTWRPHIATPNFPSYASGHATFSSTTAVILEQYFGSNYSFTDKTKISYGFKPRTYSNFNQMANEAANSRLYGGIHYDFDNREGLLCGKQIALAIHKLNL